SRRSQLAPFGAIAIFRRALGAFGIFRTALGLWGFGHTTIVAMAGRGVRGWARLMSSTPARDGRRVSTRAGGAYGASADGAGAHAGRVGVVWKVRPREWPVRPRSASSRSHPPSFRGRREPSGRSLP